LLRQYESNIVVLGISNNNDIIKILLNGCIPYGVVVKHKDGTDSLIKRFKTII